MGFVFRLIFTERRLGQYELRYRLDSYFADKLGMSTWPKNNFCDSLSARNMIKSEKPFGVVFIFIWRDSASATELSSPGTCFEDFELRIWVTETLSHHSTIRLPDQTGPKRSMRDKQERVLSMQCFVVPCAYGNGLITCLETRSCLACVQTQASPREEGSAQLRRKACYQATPVFLIFGKIIYARKLYAKYAADRITIVSKYDGV